ncbi:MAG: hypothetical protein K1X35_06515 [Caulobacteraceae bacterium]|nr:hypothetical protein [Caulobacteraceae bacterium]
MRTAFLALAALTLVAAAPAAAVTPPDNARIGRVLNEAGLVGVWGTHCDDVNSDDWETIAADARGVYQSVEGGDDYVSTYDIISARRLNSRDVQMDMVLIPDEDSDAEGDDPEADAYNQITVVYRIEGDKQMTWSSVTSRGEKLITRGVFAGGDQRSEWYYRCPNGRPTPSAAPAGDDVEAADPARDLHKAPKP